MMYFGQRSPESYTNNVLNSGVLGYPGSSNQVLANALQQQAGADAPSFPSANGNLPAYVNTSHPDWAAQDMLFTDGYIPDAQYSSHPLPETLPLKQATILHQRNQDNRQPTVSDTAPTQPTPPQQYNTVQRLLATNHKKLWDIESPSDDQISERMWINSFVGALAMGLSSGNAGLGLAAGMLAALTTHDAGYNQKTRNDHAQEMLDDGYSYGAVLKWVQTGDASLLEKDDDRMEKAREADQNNLVQQQNSQNAFLNNNLRTQIAAEQAGYNVVPPTGNTTADQFADTIKSMEGGKEHVTNSAGASGVYQQKQEFWDDNKPQGAPSNVQDATEAQQRQAVMSFYNKLKAQGYTDSQIAGAYNQGFGALQGALTAGGQAHWQDHIDDMAKARGYNGGEGQRYVNTFDSRINVPTLVSNGLGSQAERVAMINAQNRAQGKLNANSSGIITTSDGQQHTNIARQASGAPKQYTGPNGKYYIDLDTGEHIPVDNVVSESTPQQRASGNQFIEDLNTIRHGSDDSLGLITDDILGGRGDLPMMSDYNTRYWNKDSRPLYTAAEELNGLSTTAGISAAKANGQSGINTTSEINLARQGVEQLDYSSPEALKASADRLYQNYLTSHGWKEDGNGNIVDNSGSVVINGDTVSNSVVASNQVGGQPVARTDAADGPTTYNGKPAVVRNGVIYQ